MASSISKIVIQVTGESAQLVSAMTKAADSMQVVDKAAAKTNQSIAEQRRVFRALNPAITEQDKAYDRLVRRAMRVNTILRDLDDTTAHTASTMRSQSVPAVDRMNKSLARTQMMAQQGAFALDDFVAGSQTGGIAGGLRGAANNISMMATGLKSVNLQLGVIAGLAVGQLLLSQWAKHQAEQLEEARKAAEKYRKELESIRSAIENIPKLREEQREIISVFDLQSVMNREIEEEQRRHDMAFQLTPLDRRRREVEQEIENIPILNRSMEDEERLKVLEKELEAIKQQRKEILEQIEASKKIQASLEQRREELERIEAAQRGLLQIQQQEEMERQEAERRLERQNAARRGLEGLESDLTKVLDPKEAGILGILDEVERQIQIVQDGVASGVISQEEADAMIDRIQRSAEKQLAVKPDAALFSRLPSAAIQGSTADVSAINTAISGSQNIESKTLAEQQKQTRHLERIERAIDKGREDVLSVVPV